MIVIELSDDQATALEAKAFAQGLTLEKWLKGLAAKEFATPCLDWSRCQAVESIPGRRSGAWVFRDTRTPVSAVFDNLEAGATVTEVMDWFHVSQEQITAVLEFAARSLDAPSLPTVSIDADSI